MKDIDPYEVLGISNDANEEQIKKAFRIKAKETHPDHLGSREQFEDVRYSYDFLMDSDKRYLYDFCFCKQVKKYGVESIHVTIDIQV